MATKDKKAVWKVLLRKLLEENLECTPGAAIFDKPFRITMRILGAAAQHAAEIQDEKMIGYFCRLGIYTFSDPTNKEDFDQKRTDYYVSKTKSK